MSCICPHGPHPQPIGESSCRFWTQVADETVLRSDDGVGEVSFGLLQLQNLFLDGIASDQAIDKDLARSPDTVGVVDGLGFGGRIPPRVVDKHGNRRR